MVTIRHLLTLLVLCLAGCARLPSGMNSALDNYALDYNSPLNASLQADLVKLDSTLPAQYGITTGRTAVGVLDLRRTRLAMIHPDRIEYAASVPKIGILLAWFQLHPEAATHLDPQTRQELGLMTKQSYNAEGSSAIDANLMVYTGQAVNQLVACAGLCRSNKPGDF